KVQFVLFAAGPQLRYRVTRLNQIVIKMSQLGLRVDGFNLCHESTITKIERYRVNEQYSTRGVHSVATNNANGARIFLKHSETKPDYVIDLRVYDDGVAFRYVVPGSGSRVPDEVTTFEISPGSTVWFHDFEGHYEGIHQKKAIEAVKENEWVAPPLTIKL